MFIKYVQILILPLSYEVLGGLHCVLAKQMIVKEGGDVHEKMKSVEAKIFIGLTDMRPYVLVPVTIWLDTSLMK